MANGTGLCSMEFRNENLGKLYIIHGSFYFPLYILCIIVLSRKPLIEQSCYKIMLAMGVMDMVLLTIPTYVCGYWSLSGASLCDNWLAMKIAGSIINGGWVSYSWLCVVLGLNRVVESSGNQQRALFYFGGKRAWYWIVGCFVLGATYMVVFLSPYATLVYHSGIGLFLFDPKSEQTIGLYLNTVNNVVISILLILEYSMVCFHVVSFASTSDHIESSHIISSTERQIMFQAFFICFLTTCLAVGYVTIPLLTESVTIFAALNVFWQFVQGSNALVYISFNQTIRHKVMVLCRLKSENQVEVVIVSGVIPNNSVTNNLQPQFRFQGAGSSRQGWTDHAGPSVNNCIYAKRSHIPSNRVSVVVQSL